MRGRDAVQGIGGDGDGLSVAENVGPGERQVEDNTRTWLKERQEHRDNDMQE